MSTPKERIQAFLDEDINKIDALIEQYPLRLPIPVIAEFLKMNLGSVRAAVECGAFGFAWRKSGKLNKAYCIPTVQFVRWYLNISGLEGVYKQN